MYNRYVTTLLSIMYTVIIVMVMLPHASFADSEDLFEYDFSNIEEVVANKLPGARLKNCVTNPTTNKRECFGNCDPNAHSVYDASQEHNFKKSCIGRGIGRNEFRIPITFAPQEPAGQKTTKTITTPGDKVVHSKYDDWDDLYLSNGVTVNKAADCDDDWNKCIVPTVINGNYVAVFRSLAPVAMPEVDEGEFPVCTDPNQCSGLDVFEGKVGNTHVETTFMYAGTQEIDVTDEDGVTTTTIIGDIQYLNGETPEYLVFENNEEETLIQADGQCYQADLLVVPCDTTGNAVRFNSGDPVYSDGCNGYIQDCSASIQLEKGINPVSLMDGEAAIRTIDVTLYTSIFNLGIDQESNSTPGSGEGNEELIEAIGALPAKDGVINPDTTISLHPITRMSFSARFDGNKACVFAYPHNLSESWRVVDHYPADICDVKNQSNTSDPNHTDPDANGCYRKLQPDQAHCVPAPSPSPASQAPIGASFHASISQVCFDYKIGAAHYHSPFTSVVVECIEKSLMQIFIAPDSNGETIFSRLQSRLVNIVRGLLALYVIIFGYKIMLGKQVPKRDEWMWFGLRMALVIYFALASGMSDLFPKLINGSKSLATIMMSAGMGTENLDPQYINLRNAYYDAQALVEQQQRLIDQKNAEKGVLLGGRATAEDVIEDAAGPYFDNIVGYDQAELDKNNYNTTYVVPAEAVKTAAQADVTTAKGDYDAAVSAKDTQNAAYLAAESTYDQSVIDRDAKKEERDSAQVINDTIADNCSVENNGSPPCTAAQLAQGDRTAILAELAIAVESAQTLGMFGATAPTASNYSTLDVAQAINNTPVNSNEAYWYSLSIIANSGSGIEYSGYGPAISAMDAYTSGDYVEMGLKLSQLTLWYGPGRVMGHYDVMQSLMDNYRDYGGTTVQGGCEWMNMPGEGYVEECWPTRYYPPRDVTTMTTAFNNIKTLALEYEAAPVDVVALPTWPTLQDIANAQSDFDTKNADWITLRDVTVPNNLVARDSALAQLDDYWEAIYVAHCDYVLLGGVAELPMPPPDPHQGATPLCNTANANVQVGDSYDDSPLMRAQTDLDYVNDQYDGLSNTVLMWEGLVDSAAAQFSSIYFQTCGIAISPIPTDATVASLQASCVAAMDADIDAIDGVLLALNTDMDTYANAVTTADDDFQSYTPADSEYSQSWAGYDYCDFRGGDYGGEDYFMLWDTIDCKLSKFLGIGANASNPYIPQVLYAGFASIFSSNYGIPIFIFTIAYVAFIISITVRIVMTYIMAFFALVLLTFISPLLIPTVLFEKTKNIFQNWLKQIISFLLQPVILFAFLTVVFMVMEFIFFAENRDFDAEDNIVLVEKEETIPAIVLFEVEVTLFGGALSGVDNAITELFGERSVTVMRCPDETAIACIIQENTDVYLIDFPSSTFSLIKIPRINFRGDNDFNLMIGLLQLIGVAFIFSLIIGSVEEVSHKMTEGMKGGASGMSGVSVTNPLQTVASATKGVAKAQVLGNLAIQGAGHVTTGMRKSFNFVRRGGVGKSVSQGMNSARDLRKGAGNAIAGAKKELGIKSAKEKEAEAAKDAHKKMMELEGASKANKQMASHANKAGEQAGGGEGAAPGANQHKAEAAMEMGLAASSKKMDFAAKAKATASASMAKNKTKLGAADKDAADKSGAGAKAAGVADKPKAGADKDKAKSVKKSDKEFEQDQMARNRNRRAAMAGGGRGDQNGQNSQAGANNKGGKDDAGDAGNDAAAGGRNPGSIDRSNLINEIKGDNNKGDD